MTLDKVLPCVHRLSIRQQSRGSRTVTLQFCVFHRGPLPVQPHQVTVSVRAQPVPPPPPESQSSSPDASQGPSVPVLCPSAVLGAWIRMEKAGSWGNLAGSEPILNIRKMLQDNRRRCTVGFLIHGFTSCRFSYQWSTSILKQMVS